MNNTWTQDQTNESVIKQKKALYILFPILVAVFIYLNGLKDRFYVSNMEDVIEEYCQDADFLKYHSSSFCDIESIQIENQGEIYVFSCENEDTCLS
jgi:hypothetical protein